MSFNTKLGKGGYGLEVYDEEGKYASDFSFSLNGKEIKGYDNFKESAFEQIANQNGYSVKDLEGLYNSNPDFKQEIDNTLYPEYNVLVQKEVDKRNAQQIWNTPEEAAKHVHELFVPSLVQNLIDNNILKTYKSRVTGRYEVETMSACLQMSRYPKNRANLLTEQEYYDIYNNSYSCQHGNCYRGQRFNKDLIEYIENAAKTEDYIPVDRNIGSCFGDEEEIFRSFYDENSPRCSCLAHADAVACSYFGSVIYFSTGNYSYSSGRLNIQGVVKIDSKIRIMKPISNPYSYEIFNDQFPVINEFRKYLFAEDNNFEKKFKNQIAQTGIVTDPNDLDIIYNRFERLAKKDPGFCSMLMGYDALLGEGYQFNILNMGILNLKEREQNE